MLWSHNLNLFYDMPFYKKMMGSGLGSEADKVIGREDEIWSAHNDYIALLMSLGVIGLLLYILIFIFLLLDTFNYSKNNRTQAIVLSAIFASISTSMVTNGYPYRFEAHQTFWIIMGCANILLRKTETLIRYDYSHRNNSLN